MLIALLRRQLRDYRPVLWLVVLFQADVTHLIPLYAIGVFTSFTLSQAGMSVRHIRLKEKGWRLGLSVNGLGAVVTGVEIGRAHV